MTTAAVDDAIVQVSELIRSLGDTASAFPDPSWFAADFNNVILGSPYIDGTGWFPDRETAEGVAAFMIDLLNNLAPWVLEREPGRGESWTDAEQEATDSYATIVSAARKPYGGDPQGGDPVVEEQYFGDAWFLAGAALDLLDDEQRRLLDKITAIFQEAST